MRDSLGNRIPEEDPEICYVGEMSSLTNESIEVARLDPRVGCLMDRVYPGRPLVIGFGFVEWNSLPYFDFFNRVKKLEESTGLSFNRLLLRDPLNLWYQHGVPGMGRGVREVAACLRHLIQLVAPSE